MQVHTAHQGNRLGRCMFQALQTIGTMASMQMIMLTVFQANAAAQRFYKSMGSVLSAFPAMLSCLIVVFQNVSGCQYALRRIGRRKCRLHHFEQESRCIAAQEYTNVQTGCSRIDLCGFSFWKVSIKHTVPAATSRNLLPTIHSQS